MVRKVFASSIDLVIHLERDIEPKDGGLRRQTMEIRALVPSLHEDFSSEPLFRRDSLGGPLEWTGSMPPQSLVRRLERALPGQANLTQVLGGVTSW